MPTYNITADSLPVYGWISDYWSVDDWIRWFGLLGEKYGQDVAVTKFVNAFNAGPPFAAHTTWRSFNNTFIEFAKTNGFYDQLFPGISGTIARLIAGTRNTVANTAGAAENITDAAAKTAGWIVPVLALSLVGIGILFLYHKFLKD